MANFQIGDLISFTYPADPPHHTVTRAHDKYPQVLVLHPNWEGLVHGLNFKYLTPDEINTIRMIMDPSFEMRYREALRAKNPTAYQELENILGGKISEDDMEDPRKKPQGVHGRIVRVTSPRAFYLNMIRPFIRSRGWDPYRLYKHQHMSNVRIIQSSSHMTGADALAQFKAKQTGALAQEPKKGALQWFRDKFQHMRGPKLPRFRQPGEPHRPGALPGTEDEE